ncbi:MAG: DUF503 domain-containing protein [Actinomycetota bacterium]
MSGYVLAVEVDLHVPAARSLKDKRQALRPVLDRLRARLPVSVAETDGQDSWQVATIVVAVAASSATMAEELIDEAERTVWSRPDLEVTATRRTWMELEDP